MNSKQINNSGQSQIQGRERVEATCIDNSGESLIDFIITKSPGYFVHSGILSTVASCDLLS